MSVLTGLTAPSAGDGTVCGYSIVHEMDSIRGRIGVCPQADVLIDKLTVREHLQLFGTIKARVSILKCGPPMVFLLGVWVELLRFDGAPAGSRPGGQRSCAGPTHAG